MIRVRWDLEEAVVLFDLYLRFGNTLKIPEDEIDKLSQLYNKRAHKLGLKTDEKFRNVAGLRMQLACFHYIVTDGREGLSSYSKLFDETYKLYCLEPDKFKRIAVNFYNEYDLEKCSL